MRQAADAPVLFLPLQSDLQIIPNCAHDEARQIRIHATFGRLQTTMRIIRSLADKWSADLLMCYIDLYSNDKIY